MTIIHSNVYDPTHSIFKVKATDRAECQTIDCTNASCPLLARGECWCNGGLFGQACPYGRKSRERGPTKRAAGFSSWVRGKKEQHKGVPYLKPPSNKMAFIGDYVLLPYAHMTMCEAVPFKSREGIFASGNPFLPLSDWTIENVLCLLSYRPQAMMGGEIRSYQAEEIPKFLVHLREADPAMWQKLIASRPELDVAPNHIGRKAVLATLNHPIEWTESIEKGYPVRWHWDGKQLTTESMHSYRSTWGRVDVESVVIHAKPKPNATVIVQANDWVNETTEFLT